MYRRILLAPILATMVLLASCATGNAQERKDTSMDLRTLLDQKNVTLQQIRDHLTPLPREERIRQALDLKRGQMKLLWTLTENSERLRMDEIVPPDSKPLEPVPFEGLNNQPIYRYFQKVMYRTPDGKIAGYNNSDAAWFAGPGYYIMNENDKGMFVDYTQIPKEKPASWPPIKENTEGLSQFVYGNMHDYLRRIHDLFIIGRAYRHGKESGNYFILIR